VLAALHEVLDDDRGVPERVQGLHDAVDAQVAGQPDGMGSLTLDDRVVLGQVVGVAVRLRVVDQADALRGEGLVKAPVLVRRAYPPPVGGEDRLRLHRDPSHGLGGIGVPHQDVVVDEDIRQAHPHHGGSLGLEC
jgi:hypothetical protein